MPTAAAPQSYDFRHAPGHLIRRAQQVAVALFMEETAAFDVTPVQFAILNTLMDAPGIDQVSLAAHVVLDAATAGSVVGRLENKGWLRREPDAADRRRRLLWVTDEGRRVATAMQRAVEQAQERIMAPLSAPERDALMALLGKIVAGADGAPDASAA